MTNEAFKETQSHIGCSNAQLAKWLGLTPETISRYRSGDMPVPGPVEALMAALKTGWRP